MVSVKHPHFGWPGSSEAATARVAFLPAVGQSHASRRHGQEMGYFEVELGEEVLMRYECFLQGEL